MAISVTLLILRRGSALLMFVFWFVFFYLMVCFADAWCFYLFLFYLMVPICSYLHAHVYPGCALYVCIPLDDVSAMWERSVRGPTFSGPILLNGARHLPILHRICMFAKRADNPRTQPSCNLLLHDICHPHLDSLSGSLRRFRPQGFFFIVPCWAQYCPMWRTAFELGDAEVPLSSKKKPEKGFCYVGIGGRQLGGNSF